MQFGIHSLLFREIFVDKDLPLLDKCKRMGFDAVEIIPFDPDRFPAARVRTAAADLGLTINTGYGMPAQYNIISPDPAIRKAGVEFSKKLIDLSNEAGARVFGGMIYCGWGYLSGKMRTEQEWQWGVENYRKSRLTPNRARTWSSASNRSTVSNLISSTRRRMLSASSATSAWPMSKCTSIRST